MLFLHFAKLSISIRYQKTQVQKNIVTLERILLRHLVNTMKEQVDPYQFAYKQGCGTEDGVTTLVHLIAKHLDKPKTYARVLSSVFNIIQTNLLVNMMIEQKINPFLIHLYASFLANRIQIVKVSITLSSHPLDSLSVTHSSHHHLITISSHYLITISSH